MKLWPARTKKTAGVPITDLDAIIAEPVYFQLKGKIHELQPMSLESFLKFTNAQAALMNLAKEDGPMTAKSLANKYLSVISSVCSTITIDDILEMEQVQVAALYQLVIDLVTGQVDLGEGKKKRLKIPIYEYAQASSLQNVPESSDGPSDNP